jgi:hypothetical protein
MYVDEVKYDETHNLYYVAMRHESRQGIAEFCVELDFAATNSPFVIIKDQPFHSNDFPVLLFKRIGGNAMATTTINIGDMITFKPVCGYPTSKVTRKVVGIYNGLPEVEFAGYRDFIVRLSEIVK